MVYASSDLRRVLFYLFRSALVSPFIDQGEAQGYNM